MSQLNERNVDWQARFFTVVTLILFITMWWAEMQWAKIGAGVAVLACVVYVVAYLYKGDRLSAILPGLYVVWGVHTILVPALPVRAAMAFDGGWWLRWESPVNSTDVLISEKL